MREFRWAPRVEQKNILKLYEEDSKNIINKELLEEVGISLYLRAESIISVNQIHSSGICRCPVCSKMVKVSCDKQYICHCGWTIDALELHQTYKGKQLVGADLVDLAKNFISDWNNSLRDSAKQMMAIDYLIHRFHWEMTNRPTRPVAVNFIEGSMTDIKRLILNLAYSDNISRKQNREHWLTTNAISVSIWDKEVGTIKREAQNLETRITK